jgi:hypothetical protein
LPLEYRLRVSLYALFVVLANAADLASTFLASPDLAGEWNVLERWLGLGWAGLVIAKLLGGWLAVAGYAYYLRNRAFCYPPMRVDARAFSRWFLFGPPNVHIKRHTLCALGYFWAGMQLLVVWVAADNIGIAYGVVSPLRGSSDLAYHLMQSWTVGLLVALRYLSGNYQRFERATREGVLAAVHQPGTPADTLR